MNEFNIKNGFISNSNSRVLGTLTATTLNVQILGSGTPISNLGIDSSGNFVTGTSGGGGTSFTGGTVTGSTTFTNGLSANTISATTYFNLPTDIYTTGATYSNNNFLFTNNTGGTFNVLFNTVTGLTVNGLLKSTTLSATSINTVDYIVFNTGTTSAATQAGTVYFDNTEHALSYNTSINQGVTVNLGQQNYLRVFNNSGADIPRGKALEVLSAYSGLPSVTLAINKHTGFDIIGVSAEIIPNNSEGIAITNGIISNIELTGMTVGSLVYASDTVAGKLDNATKYLSFPLTARTNQIGFVVQTGVTTGKLFIDINNENSVLSLTDLERNVLEGNVISTGAFEYTGMTTASTTTFNVASLKGWLIKNTYEYALTPDVQSINYTGGTNISVTNIASADSTYILINSGLTITQQVTFPTPQERRQNIYLGKINHPNRSTILNINNTVDYDVSPLSSLRDLWSPIKLINQGIIPSPNGANLSFNTSAGILWGNGINWHNNQLNPNSVSISGKSPASFFYRTQTGGTSTSVTVINPRNYDVGGTITSIGNANLDSATNQRIYIYPTGVINVLYGQTVYASLTAAVAAVQSEAFIPYPNAEANGILIGVLSVRNDIGTDGQPLSNASYAKFTFVSKFGENFGGTGGLSTTTLQQAYDNSTNPEIVINAALDGLSIKNGTGNSDITTRLLEGLNSAGNATSFIRADGDISGTTLQTNGFTGNTTGMSALTVNIRTVGSGTPITNLGVDILGNVVSGTTGGSTFTGGTVSGTTFFTNGLTANTISATTYYGLPTDVYSTGGTYNGGNIYVTNNTGGTFTITGLTSTGFSANYYGSFSDTTTQPVSGASIATLWTYNTTEISNGISLSGNSRIKVANKGVYEIGYSAQLEKTQGTNSNVTIWGEKNGIIIPRTSSTLGLVSNSTLQLPFVSFIFELEANDYIEFYMSSDSQHVQLTTISASTLPTRPLSPSVIIVAKQIGLSVTDNLGGYYLPLSGGTVTGGTVFNNGLTANTFSATTIKTASFTANNGGITATTVSATTYYNLPKTTLQEAYTASTSPEFTINSTQLGVQFRNDTGDDNTPMIVVQNNAGIDKGEWRADGTIYAAGLYSDVVSAMTYQNLPIDIFTTGGTYDTINGIATFTNNTGGTFNVNGFSTGGGSAFTGGTVTGSTNFTNGLTANTISATTYYNLPISTDIYTTGGTYSNGSILFTNNTGGTFNVNGLYTGYTAPIDVYTTGGTYSNGSLLFTNNTGGTFNINTSTNYAAGVISGATYSMDGIGQINLPAIKVALYNNTNNIEPIIVYDVASGTTGTGGIPGLVDQDTNYIVVEYNGGSPRYYVYDNDGVVDDSSVVLFMIAYRTGSFIHTLEFGNQGAGLANKLNDRFIMTDRFGWESGLSLSLSASTGIVMVTSGVAWNGPNRQSLTAVDSSGSTFFKNYHTGGAWTYTTTGKTINNTYYDNGTDIVSATASKYLTNWYFRGQEINSHLYEVFSTTQYDSVALAQLATEPSLPELITSHAILLGRVVVQVGASTGLTESAFNSVFQSTQVTSHNDLTNLQGGTAGEYYHLTSNQYNNLVFKNVNNNFTTGQTITGNLTVTGGTQSLFSGNSASDLVRITQTGSGNAFVVEDSATPDSSSFVINNAGRVGVGTTTSEALTSKVNISNNDNSKGLYIKQNTGYYGLDVFGFNTAINAYVEGTFNLYGTTDYPIGVNSYVTDGIEAIAIRGMALSSEFGTPTTLIGGYFLAGGYGAPNQYSVQLQDGTQGINKVLVSKTSDGKANWSDTLTGLTSVAATTVSATTLYGDGSNITNITPTVPYGIINAIVSGNYLI